LHVDTLRSCALIAILFRGSLGQRSELNDLYTHLTGRPSSNHALRFGVRRSMHCVGSATGLTLRNLHLPVTRRIPMIPTSFHDCYRAEPFSKEKPQVRVGGAPGARTLNPRINRRPLHRSRCTACTNVPRICTESAQRTASASALVPRAVPRTECRGWRASLPSVADSTMPSAAPRPRTPALSLGPCLGSCWRCSGRLCPRSSSQSLASLPVDRPVHGKG
jgi:hypothetical protein